MGWDARKASFHALESLAVMVLYFVAARIGLTVPFTHGNVSPIWPSAGIALGAILIFGRHVCLGIAAGAFLANFFTPIPHLAAVVLGVGNTLGPAVAASFLLGELAVPIQRLRDVLSLILFGSLGTAISALIGSSTLFLAGVNTGSGLRETIAVWCFGDLMGVFLVTPLFLNFADFKLTRPRLAELALLMASLLAASELLFRQNTIAGAVFGLLLLPFVLWGAARFSIGGATLICLVASTFAVWETGRGIGPFLPYGTSVHHVHALQMFIAALSLSGLSLAAVIAERTKAEAALAREEKLRRTEEQYRNIIETTNDGVWMIDSDFRTTFVNRRMAEMLGYTAEEMLRRTPFDFAFPEDTPRNQADLALRWKSVREVFYTRYRKKDGSELWTLVSSAPVSSVTGTFAGALTMHCDVTLLRKTEETLRRNEKLITAGRLAATVAHEINNPLAALTNLLFLMRTDNNPEYLNMAEDELARISHIAKQTLGFYRNDPNPAPVNLTDVIEGVLARFRGKVRSRGVHIETSYQSQAEINGYANELGQVFGNLIGNALEAMGSGGTLRVHTVSCGHGLRVTIADNGRGIERENLGKVFQPFFTTNKEVGTGLGLWLTREIVEKHGGSIRVKSSTAEQRHGTVFMIWLPVNLPLASTPAA